MATHADTADGGDMATGVIPVDDRKPRGVKPARNSFVGIARLVPGFGYLLILFILGFYLFKDPRAAVITLGAFKLSWVEVILFLAAVIACAEILKVSEPGVNNTGEVVWMGVVAIIQFGLIVASLYDERLTMFKSTESVEMLLINAVQTLVAFHVNSRSLVRTIAGSPATA